MADTLVRGVINSIKFKGNDGYIVFEMYLEDSGNFLTVQTSASTVSVGSTIIARGEYKMHQKFGKQFVARAIELVPPTTNDGLIRYLSGGAIKGIGPKFAKLIVDKFGEKTLETVKHNPEQIATIRGISLRKALEIANLLNTNDTKNEIERFFSEYDIPLSTAEKVYDVLGEKCIEIITQNPYILAYRIKGIGFLKADEIARKLGIPEDSPERLKAGLIYSLEHNKENGHTYLEESELISQASSLLKLNDTASFSNIISFLASKGALIKEDNAIYSVNLYNAEKFVASFIVNKSKIESSPFISEKILQEAIRESEENLKIKLSEEQKTALELATKCRFLTITGGPGCGKTTIIRALSQLFARSGMVLALGAPTGKAAQRMSQVCEMPAKTIHRLLGYDPVRNDFTFGPNNPLALATPDGEYSEIVDAVIIDESSMIDIELAKRLFSSIPAKASLILVGDKDQLPSVGPGRLFADLLSIPTLPSIRLTQLYRRAEESSISVIARDINQGIPPKIPSLGEVGNDAYFVEINEPEKITQYVINLITKQIPKYRGIDPANITVLTPSNVGPVGTLELNKQIQAALNPINSKTNCIESNGQFFNKGDRICQRVNNYKIDLDGVFNGDTGTIYEVDPINKALTVKLWDGRYIRYQKQNLDEISLAYAITIHRSQGSEFPCVIIVMHDSQYSLLEKQLLYTGVTRAKGLLFIVGSRRALATAIRRETAAKRRTKLIERIEAAMNRQN